MNVLDVLLINILKDVGSQAIRFTAHFWIGPLYYGQEEVELTFKKCELLREEKFTKVYELEATFSAQRYPKVAKWLMVNDECVHLFGHLFIANNRMTLYADKKHATGVLDYQPEGEEAK
ncbi:MAG: hypothetical protein WCT16_02300 [Candidatus Buchananbacteria bacterium]